MRRFRVLLIVAASSRFWRVFNSWALSMPPIGLLSMAAVLKMHGHEVLVLGLFRGLTATELRRKVTEFDPHLVGISCHTESYDSTTAISRLVRDIVPGTPIVWVALT